MFTELGFPEATFWFGAMAFNGAVVSDLSSEAAKDEAALNAR